MTKTRTRDPEATKQAILEAAEALFLERGLGNTPLSLIAKTAGVTKSLIHHHFESKENLWSEVKHQAFMDYAAKQGEIQNRDGEVTLETLRDSVVAYFRSMQKNPRIVRLMAWMTIEEMEGECDHCMHESVLAWGVAQIEEAQKKGIIRDDIPAIHVVMSFLSMTAGWFQDRKLFRKWLVDDSGDLSRADDLFLESALKIILTGVGEKTFI